MFTPPSSECGGADERGGDGKLSDGQGNLRDGYQSIHFKLLHAKSLFAVN
jgi:hypothetical protein